MVTTVDYIVCPLKSLLDDPVGKNEVPYLFAKVERRLNKVVAMVHSFLNLVSNLQVLGFSEK